MSDEEIAEKVKNETKTLDIFPSNITAFDVFRDLPIDKTIGGMGGVIYEGFKRSEIESTMNIHGIPQEMRKETLGKLGVMESKVVQILNSKK